MPDTIQYKRCAIYTRKSVEDDDVKEFNSNDAQRESAESFIASQRGNGWKCLSEKYDDYGYSGGNVNRPALKRLLADAENGLIDIVVVYKIDRLSRSITDFAELSKLFDKWGVSFVAVTQDINTSTSSGRMMLNILMTFAQYEREVIAERIRDKMSATRKKGKWTGGPVPFGYRIENKKLEENIDESDVVRRIYQRFIEIQSPKQIAAEINADGITDRKGQPWNTGLVYRTLHNHIYIGEVKYEGQIYQGEHKGIISREVWDRVHEIMLSNNPIKDQKGKVEIIAPLKGLFRCGHCDCAMSPTYALRNKQKYFYYVCAKEEKRGEALCPVHRVPAADVEDIIMAQLIPLLKAPEVIANAARSANIDYNIAHDILGSNIEKHMTAGEKNRLASLLIEKAVIFENRIEIEIRTSGVKSLIEEMQNEHDRAINER